MNEIDPEVWMARRIRGAKTLKKSTDKRKLMNKITYVPETGTTPEYELDKIIEEDYQ